MDFVQVREKDLGGRALTLLVKDAVDIARSGTTCVLVNDRLDVAWAASAKGVHLPSDGLPAEVARKIAPPGFVVGVSTHTKNEVDAAARAGADFVVFGPVFDVRSKRGARALGLAALEEVIRTARVPVFALGGITPDRVEAVARTGAAGIAGISAFVDRDEMAALFTAVASRE